MPVSRSSMRLMERFPIRPAGRPAVADAMLAIVLDVNRKDRARATAARVLVAMDRLNLDAERGAGPQGVTVNIVNQNQAIVNNPDKLEDSSDADLNRICAATASQGDGGAIEADSSPVEPS